MEKIRLLIGKEFALEHIDTFIDILKDFAYPNVRRIKNAKYKLKKGIKNSENKFKLTKSVI